MDPEGSLQCLQGPAIDLYPELHASNPRSPNLFS
jgi:hypothetical protein